MDHRYAACSFVLVVACGKDGPGEETNPFVTAAQTTVAAGSLGDGDTGDGDTGEDEEDGSSSGDPVTGPPPLTESSGGETSADDGSTGGSEGGTTGGVMVVEFDDCPTFDMATCGLHTQCVFSETGCTPNPAYCQAFDQAQCDLEVECVFGGVFVGQTCTVDCTALEQTTCPMVAGYCYYSDGSDGQLPGCYPLG
jgi:hypothetical protein